MSLLKKHDLKLYRESDPSTFLFEKLNAFVELFSFLDLTAEIHEDLPHYGFRIVPNPKTSVEKNLQVTLNSFPEFFVNRIIPHLHYFVDRGPDLNPINEVVLLIVYYDFVAKYKINLHDMDMKSPSNLTELKPTSLQLIKDIDKLLDLNELSEVCFNDPVFNREHILKEISDDIE